MFDESLALEELKLCSTVISVRFVQKLPCIRKVNHDSFVCTKTLYNYVDAGLLTIANIDLPLKVKRSTKTAKIKQHKKNFGTSIDERPIHINERSEFGHWEIDTVIGKKDKSDAVLLTMTERMTQKEIIRKIPSKTVEAVQNALLKLADEAGECFSKVLRLTTALSLRRSHHWREKQPLKCISHIPIHPMSVVLMSATMVL